MVNGTEKRTNTVSHMRFSPAFLISFHSKVMPLYPGDIISPGTPGAIHVKHGDVVECRIPGVGTLVNPVEARTSTRGSTPVAEGLGASPGSAVGRVALDSATAAGFSEPSISTVVATVATLAPRPNRATDALREPSGARAVGVSVGRGNALEIAEGYGWTIENASFDWPKFLETKDLEIARLSLLRNLQRECCRPALARRPVEQGLAEVGLQLLDLQADGTGRAADHTGCGREASLVKDCQESGQVGKIQHACIPSSSWRLRMIMRITQGMKARFPPNSSTSRVRR